MIGNFILHVLNLLFAAWCISEAVSAFKNGKYFRFGLEITLAISFATILIKYAIIGG